MAFVYERTDLRNLSGASVCLGDAVRYRSDGLDSASNTNDPGDDGGCIYDQRCDQPVITKITGNRKIHCIMDIAKET